MRAGTAKRLLLIAVGALLLVSFVLLHFRGSGNRQWRAETLVIVKPYTNALVSRSFKSHIVRTIPGVLSLGVGPSLSGSPGSGTPASTNGVGMVIVAFGTTPEEAEGAANEAARRICQIALTNYGGTGEVIQQAMSARKYSYFQDSFRPTIVRWFTP